MSSIEHTFTAVPNALFPALVKVSFSPYEWRVILCIWRKSWGYHRQTCDTSYRDIAALTNIAPQNVHRTIKALVEKNVLYVKRSKKGSYIQFNSDPVLWRLPEKDDDRQLSLRLGPMRVKSVITGENTPDDRVSSPEMTEVSSLESTPRIKKKEILKERGKVSSAEITLFRLFG